MTNYLLLTPILLPVLAGLLMLILPEMKKRRFFESYVFVTLLGTVVLVFMTAFKGESSVTLFELTKGIPIYFRVDNIGRTFSMIVALVFMLAGIYALEYMSHMKNRKRFFGFFLILFGVVLAIDYAGNLITFYLFYEIMTLVSIPIVIHDLKKESIMAGLKYLFYSLFGAYCVLFGIYFLYRYGNGFLFSQNSLLVPENIGNEYSMLLIAVFSMIIGFSVKAGMFPLHAWLSAAHPVAPAPASAVLSAIIVKTGVLGIIRVVFFVVGTEFLRNTWVQTVWTSLTLITIFMGSMLAYREKILKKRLAYSTVSQVSYILFGISLLTNETGVAGIMHVVCHAFIKCGLFLAVGSIIYKTGKTRVEELRGVGKEMPITMWCFTILSLALIGIPPTGGFISKWELCINSLKSNVSVFSWLGPIVLLISALLTALYLLPIAIKAFFPGEDYPYQSLEKKEPGWKMLLPLIILTTLAVLMGIVPQNPLTRFFY